MILISLKERTAKTIKFDDETTLILGENDTGKSVLIKSIYNTFGAEVKFEEKWKKASVISIVKFLLEEEEYYIFRHKKEFAIFDKDKNLIKKFSSITKELSPFFSELFNFKIKLINKENKSLNAPPAYCFLPFYIDQDSGWVGKWASFMNLSQFKGKWRNDLTKFHSGIRPSEYYVVGSKKEKLLQDKESYADELKLFKRMLSKILEEFGGLDPSINTDFFQKELKDLLYELNSLKLDLQERKEKMKSLYDEKSLLENQKLIVEKAFSEISKDYEYSSNIEEDHIDCPTCGASYSNSFSERFSIAQDEGACQELLASIRENLEIINNKILKEDATFMQGLGQINKIKTLLEINRSEIKLKDMIENEGKKNILEIIKANIDKLEKELGQIELNIKEIDKELRGIDNKERRKLIIEDYKKYMESNLIKLGVETLPKDKWEELDCQINVSGSDKPRAILAYYFAMLNLISKYSTSVFCPMIIDSPNQQDQDQMSLKRIFNLINEMKPKGTQLILGTVDVDDTLLAGERIVLKEKYKLLSEKDYDKTYPVVEPFLNQINM